MQHANAKLSLQLPVFHLVMNLTLPVPLACNLQPLAASAKKRPAFAASADACYVAHATVRVSVAGAACVLSHAALQHAAARRGAAAYGDAHLLFGRPKMLISAYPFAPFFVAP